MSPNHLRDGDLAMLERAVATAAESRSNGNHPFGAVLVDDGAVVLAGHNSVNSERDLTGHAELNLVRVAGSRYSPAELARMTAYSSCEPCAMCAGAFYWSGIGRVVYALSEVELLAITGANPENLTMSLSCRTVLAAGQRQIDVVGPVSLQSAYDVHAGFWTSPGARGQ